VNDSCTSSRYQVYLLRLWQERPASPGRAAVWRFSLEDPRTGRRHGFANLEGLMAFLRERLEIREHETQSVRCETCN